MSRRTPTQSVFPALPETSNRLFWLSLYLRCIAKAQALRQQLFKNRRASNVLRHALITGFTALENEADDSFEYVVKSGYLLMAWGGTTIFNEVAA